MRHPSKLHRSVGISRVKRFKKSKNKSNDVPEYLKSKPIRYKAGKEQ